MSDPIDAFRQANALDVAAYPAGSRYHGVATATWTAPDGSTHRYSLRRPLPDPADLTTLATVRTQAGDRPDLLAARHLGDPLSWWRLADANGVSDPAALTAAPGSTVRLTLPAGLEAADDD
ncbi:LysM domain-containing protein [Sphingomonas sp. 1P06PA]|uniref:LysM domain-containing protein n=1 Tax=Sphingomonas sp. 1P06PA TaxID=554121 RepID=UPI0039A6E69E